MTGPRRARSAGLLVGSTPVVVVKVQSAGQIVRRLHSELAVPAVAPALGAGVLEQLPKFCLDRGDLGLQSVAVVVLVLVGAPRDAYLLRERQALLADGPRAAA